MPTESDLWQRAASFAARTHRLAVRRDGETPYVAHPFRVALTISRVFSFDDETTLAAALLHDVIEDTDTDYDEIAMEFNSEVADLVGAMSKDMRLPEADREPAYDEQLRGADWRARLIKVADQYDNLIDAIDGGFVEPKTIGRCKSALSLAGNDDIKVMARAVNALEAVLARAEGEQGS